MSNTERDTGSDDRSPNGLRAVPRWRSLLCLSLVFLVAVVTYRHTTKYWFLTADSLALVETSRVHTVADLVALFARPLMDGSSFTDVALFYRPVSSLSYALDYALWGLWPAGYHWTNVVLHALAAVLVALLVAELTERLLVAGLTGVVFAVHPLTVGVVPGIARRQDILLTMFVLVALLLVVRGWRENRPGSLAGALVAYALALGAKETALVVPGLVFLWVALHSVGRWRTRAGQALRATAPFVGVTAGYVVVRLAVLGGLGGYRSGIGTEPNAGVVFLPLKYLLWLARPTSLVETVPVGLRELFLVLAAGGVLVGAVLVGRAWSRGRLEPAALLLWVLSLGAFAGFVCLFAITERVEAFPSTVADTMVRYLTDSSFVGGCLAGLLAAGRTVDSPFDAPTRRLLAFLAGWIVAIPGLLVVTGAGIGAPLDMGDQIQTGYLCLVPAMAGLSLVLVTVGERLLAAARSEGVVPNANVVVVLLTTLLLGSLLVVSPLVQPSTVWERAGESNQRALTGLDGNYTVDPTADVSIRGAPDDDYSPLVVSTQRLSDYTVEAWLRLRASPDGHVAGPETTNGTDTTGTG